MRANQEVRWFTLVSILIRAQLPGVKLLRLIWREDVTGFCPCHGIKSYDFTITFDYYQNKLESNVWMHSRVIDESDIPNVVSSIYDEIVATIQELASKMNNL